MAKKFEELRAKMSPERRRRSDEKAARMLAELDRQERLDKVAVLLCADADVASLLQRLKPLVRAARGEEGHLMRMAFQALDNVQVCLQVALRNLHEEGKKAENG